MLVLAMTVDVNYTWLKDPIDSGTGEVNLCSDNVRSDFVSWLLDISRQVDHEGHTHQGDTRFVLIVCCFR